MAVFNFCFDELPLAIINGIEAALINGEAEIEYEADGYWTITDVVIDGYRAATPEELKQGSRPFVSAKAPLPAGPLYNTICDRLEGEWRERVQDAVREQLGLESEAA